MLPPLSKTASTHALDVEGGTTSVNTGVHNSANFFKPVAARLKGRKDKDRSPARSLIADVLHGIRAASSVASRVGSALAPDKSSKSVAPDPRFAEARSSTVQPPLARAPSQNSKPDLWDAKPRQDSTLQPANSMAVGPRFTSFQPGMVQRVGSVTGPGQGGGQHSSTQGKTMDSSREIRKRALKDFRREIRLVSSLRHPNIITVMGACNDDVRPRRPLIFSPRAPSAPLAMPPPLLCPCPQRPSPRVSPPERLRTAAELVTGGRERLRD